MKLSIVSTLYNSALFIEEFCIRATKVACQMAGDDYEIILVNDGSPDNSIDLAVKLCESDSHIIVIDLSRNFGHHKAMMTGLTHSKGDMVFLIDSDLEEEPEWLLSFAEQKKQEKSDVVYGVQQSRKGNFFERWSGKCFYRLFAALTGFDFPENIVTARLMSRQYVDALILHKERELMIAGLWFITGFAQKPQIINKHNTSKTTYSLRHKLSVLVNSITSFSNVPLKFIFYMGVVIFIIALCYTGFLFINKVFLSDPLSGWTSVIASIWLLGGLIISFIGIIGIYLAKIFSEVKQRPYTIIRHIYGKHGSQQKDT